MRYLLDTHAFLWATSRGDELSAPARSAIEDPAAEIFVSVAVAWEISIKFYKGNLRLALDPAAYFSSRMARLGFADLDISREHTLAAGALPPIHADPFDRIMIAQAQIEDLVFVTRDARSLTYGVRHLRA